MRDPNTNNLEEQKFLTIDEAASFIGWNRATVFEWMKELEIEKHKFLRNKKTYIRSIDAKRLKQIKEKPWAVDAIKEELDQEKKEKSPEDSAA